MLYENELAATVSDPAVREAVFASVTPEEAYQIMRSPVGKPWNDAAAVIIADGYGEDIGDSMRKVRDLPMEYGRG
jgi:predicted NAD-dependent protein-ADP-ribosyltransferase YbiA (DUF1768 family)